MSCEDFFLEKLREQGFRRTPQRDMVLSVMHKLDDFATADEIYHHVRALSSAVDISTIYRTLDLLQDFQLVAAVDAGDGQRRFKLEGVHEAHLHLVCRRCGAVIGSDIAPIEPLVAYARERHGFAIEPDHLSITGLCRACAAAPDRPTLPVAE
jgi:Fur family ferric uptake transcriptional regulator